MNNKQMKKATVDAINVMISHADKGPSGFWVEDHEGWWQSSGLSGI